MHRIHAMAHSKLLAMTGREEQLLILASEGHCDSSIAKTLGISRGTVLSLWARLRAKLGQQSRIPAIAGAISSISRQLERCKTISGEMWEAKDSGFVLVSRHGIVLAANTFAVNTMGCRLGHPLGESLDPQTWPEGCLSFDSGDLATRLVWPVALRQRGGPTNPTFSAFVLVLDDPFIGKTAAIRFRLEPTPSLAVVQASTSFETKPERTNQAMARLRAARNE